MSIENVRAYLKGMNCPKEPIEFSQSSATVELAQKQQVSSPPASQKPFA